MYKHRAIEEEVKYAATVFKVVLLVGARQVGKSTLLRTLFPEYPMVTFHPTADDHGARRDPAFF